MNTNPLQPEGTIQPKGKSNIKIAIFTILAIHVVLIGGLLIQGCKPAAQTTENTVPDATQPTAATSSDVPPMTTDNLASTSLPTDITPAPTAGSTVAATPNTVTPTATVPATTSVASLPVTPTPTVTPVVTPTPTTTDVTSAPVGETQVHTVAKGEMLSTIARKYHVTVRAVEEANPGINAMKLQIGQKLNIPAPTAAAAAAAVATTTDAPAIADSNIYVVKSGDMLEKIAKAHGTTVKAIKAANNMKTDRINIGQKLKIPTTRTASVAPATTNQ